MVVPHSRTLYFNDKGRERGISADFVRDFERYINQKYRKQLGKRPITVVIRPTTRDVLLTSVAEGFADIAVGNLTVTEERLKLVDLVAPGSVQPVSELVLSGPKSPPITAAEELSGQTVHVRKSSSYYESLLALNDRLEQMGKPPANLVFVPDALEDEDMMEMLNAGILEAIVVDDWKARMWAQVLPRMKVSSTAIVRTGGQIGWAIRKDSPKLAAILNEFYTNFVKKQGMLEARMKQYYGADQAAQGPDRLLRTQALRGHARRCSESTASSTASIRSCSRLRATRSRSSIRAPRAMWGPSASCRSCPPPGRN